MSLLREYIREVDTPHFAPEIRDRIYNEEYVRVVLGIDLPLNESRPYSVELQQRILEEQLLLEGFFSDFKKLGGDTKNAALALRYIMQDSSRLQEYMGLVKESLEDAYKSLAGFLESILEAVEGLSTKVASALKKVSEWASNLLKKVKSFVEGALAGDGWKGAMILSGALVGIGFIWSKLEGPAPKILEGLANLKEAVEESALLAGSYLFEGEDEEEVPEDSKAGKIIKKITSLLFTVVKKIGAKAFKGLAVDTIGAALTGGISAAFKALKALYGGSKIVFMFLGDPIKKFLGKIKNPEEEAEEAEEGEDDPTDSKNEALLREWVRTLLTESVDPKIMSMIDELENNGGYAEVLPDRVILFQPTENTPRRWVAMVAYETTVGAYAGGRCGGAESVVQSATAKTGLGPLAYDIAIELTGGLGMISDRATVSKDAEAVWAYYLNNRPDVEAVQLDDPFNSLTPEDGDNCDQEVAGGRHAMYGGDRDRGKDWLKSPLSKLYKKSGTPVMDELRKRGMLK